MRNLFVGVGTGLLIRELVQLGDAFTNTQNRIRTVTAGEQELAIVTQNLFNIARETRSAFDATAEVYTRTALAAKNLGITQGETLEFTRSLNQAVVLSGASGTEAKAGLIQLSQGLASGALRGDELRSVLEQLPVVADVIADSLGITRGELRVLGATGAISADIILKAFREAREELAERFGKTVPTVSQAFTVLRNEVVRNVGALDSQTGATALLSTFILDLADNADSLAIGLGVVFEILAEFGPIVANDAAELFGMAAALVGVDSAAQGTAETIAIFADRTLGLLVGLGNALIALGNGIGPAIGDLFFQVINSIIAVFESGLDTARAFFGTISDQSASVGTAILNFFGSIAAALQLLVSGQASAALEVAGDAVETFGNSLVRTASDTSAVFRSNLQDLRVEETIGQLENPFRNAAAGLGDAVTQGMFEGLDVTFVQDVLADIQNRVAESRAEAAAAGGGADGASSINALAIAQARLNDLLNDGTLSAQEYAAAMLALREGQEKAAESTDVVSDKLTRNEAIVNDALSGAFGAAEDALVSFITTGEADFSAFVDSVLADIARLLVRQAILGLFGGGGAAASAGSSILGFADGGNFDGSQPFIAGEEGPEIITPEGGGNVIPAGETAAIMRGQAPTVNVSAPPATVNVNNFTDPNEVPAGIESTDGEQAVMNVIRKNKGTVKQAIG
tara:strand:- start:18234 stop:20288 length:2055 start_codon:yes stop_codon:yes gene_type:complete